MITETNKGFLVHRGDMIHIASENRWLHKKHFVHSGDWMGVYHKTRKSAEAANAMMSIPTFMRL